MFENLSHPIIFAHRGASTYAPENTLASFRLALSQGADAVELDVRLSADGQVVVMHDPIVDRTTNGHGRVAQLTLTELRSLDAGSFFSEKYRGEKIPLLEEVFEAVGRKMFINVELKNSAATCDQLIEKVCALVKNRAWKRESSFHPSWRPILKKQNDYCLKFLAVYLLPADGRGHGLVPLDLALEIMPRCIHILRM